MPTEAPRSGDVLLDVNDGIAIVRLNRADVNNRFDDSLMIALRDMAIALRDRTDINVVLLAGEPTFFSAGADLDSNLRPDAEKPRLLELRQQVRLGPDMCEAWERLEQITIVAIDGYCVGGAAALALACDFRILGAGGRMRLPEVPLGINMSWRSLPRLASLVGPSRAKRFAIMGEFLNAETALDWGMADEVAAEGKALEAAQFLAKKINALPPLAVRMTKETINAVVNANHFAAAHMDRDQFLLTFGTQDFEEAVSAFFEKRAPKFKGD